MAQTIELPDVLTSAMDAVLQGVWTALPGRVESYDSVKQTVNIQATVKNGYISESGDRKTETLAVMNSVPVIFLGGGGFRTTYPIRVGDTALVVVMSRSISQWLAQGGVVDPRDDRKHTLGDSVALIGLRDYLHSLKNAPTDRMSIGADAGATIEIHQNEVRIGSNDGTQPTIMGNSFLTAFNTLIAAVATAVGSSGTPAGATAASADITAALTIFDNQASGYLTTVAKVV